MVPNNTGSHAIVRVACLSGTGLKSQRIARPSELNGRGFVSRRIDLDAALKVGPVFDANSSARNITDNGAVFCNFDASTGIDVADSFTIDNHSNRIMPWRLPGSGRTIESQSPFRTA